MSTGPVWLQRMVKRGGIYGLITAVAGIIVHPMTAKILHLPAGDAEASSYLMFIGVCLTGLAKPLQQWFHDLLCDTAAPGGDEANYAGKPNGPDLPPPAA